MCRNRTTEVAGSVFSSFILMLTVDLAWSKLDNCQLTPFVGRDLVSGHMHEGHTVKGEAKEYVQVEMSPNQ